MTSTRLVNVGDKLILASFMTVEDADVARHEPTVVLVSEGNEVREVKSSELGGARVG
jgi:aspartate 1-decarboxylase